MIEGHGDGFAFSTQHASGVSAVCDYIDQRCDEDDIGSASRVIPNPLSLASFLFPVIPFLPKSQKLPFSFIRPQHFIDPLKSLNHSLLIIPALIIRVRNQYIFEDRLNIGTNFAASMAIEDSKECITIPEGNLANGSVFHLSPPALHLAKGVLYLVQFSGMKLLCCQRFREVNSHVVFLLLL